MNLNLTTFFPKSEVNLILQAFLCGWGKGEFDTKGALFYFSRDLRRCLAPSEPSH